MLGNSKIYALERIGNEEDQVYHRADHHELEKGRGQGKSILEACREIGVCEQTYYRWRNKYGNMSTSDAKKLKDLEKENERLKRIVADLSIDNAVLKEAVEGKF